MLRRFGSTFQAGQAAESALQGPDNWTRLPSDTGQACGKKSTVIPESQHHLALINDDIITSLYIFYLVAGNLLCRRMDISHYLLVVSECPHIHLLCLSYLALASAEVPKISDRVQRQSVLRPPCLLHTSSPLPLLSYPPFTF